jgi:hypothetical protein
MELKLDFKTAFPYGFSGFFIDNRLVNRVGTASLVRSAAAEADIPPSSEHSASFHKRYRAHLVRSAAAETDRCIINNSQNM